MPQPKIVVLTRCSRPDLMQAVHNSVLTAAKQCNADVKHVVLVDAYKVKEQPIPGDVVEYINKVGKDTYMSSSLNWAIWRQTEKEDWIIVLDDDTLLQPEAIQLIQRNHKGNDMLLWDTDADDIDFCGMAFTGKVARWYPFEVGAGAKCAATFARRCKEHAAAVLQLKVRAGSRNILVAA